MNNQVQWQAGWRDEIWSQLDGHWDLIIIGGGITGAGILQEAVRSGYSALLVDGQDFSAGTSSRSSKLVHGGFRYMANAQFQLTYESVHERERLLKDGKGLINHLDILMPMYPSTKVPGWALELGLLIYSLMAGKIAYRRVNKMEMINYSPGLLRQELRGGFQYYDANTDDARLTLRVIKDAVASGGTALNYAKVVDLLRDIRGNVQGVVLADQANSGRFAEVQASLVINATGAWADSLRKMISRETRLRPLQGSHLILPYDKLPMEKSISIFHPRDGRPVFTLPWEGVTLVGTTDLDTGHQFSDNPVIKELEISYLFEFLRFAFPELEIEQEDIICSLSGIRPVIDTGKANPSKESREYAIWLEDNMLTVTGGKLTTFRLMARDVIRETRKVLRGGKRFDPRLPLFLPDTEITIPDDLEEAERMIRLFGRYGAEGLSIEEDPKFGDLDQIETTAYSWSELRWAARMEGVVHLDDLLLRRIRLGILLPGGGRNILPQIRNAVQPELGWDDQHWQEEERRYLAIWEEAYQVK